MSIIETKTDLEEIQCTGRFMGSLVILSDRSVYLLVKVENLNVMTLLRSRLLPRDADISRYR